MIINHILHLLNDRIIHFSIFANSAKSFFKELFLLSILTNLIFFKESVSPLLSVALGSVVMSLHSWCSGFSLFFS